MWHVVKLVVLYLCLIQCYGVENFAKHLILNAILQHLVPDTPNLSS